MLQALSAKTAGSQSNAVSGSSKHISLTRSHDVKQMKLICCHLQPLPSIQPSARIEIGSFE